MARCPLLIFIDWGGSNDLQRVGALFMIRVRSEQCSRF